MCYDESCCVAQGHKGACTISSNLFKKYMKQLHYPVDYSTQSVYVPSYREKYPLIVDPILDPI